MTAHPATLTLSAFVLARIAEDEAVARECLGSTDPDWSADRYRITYGGEWEVAEANMQTAPHIARHDPARVLAECEAKRRIVELAREATALDMQVDSEFSTTRRDEVADPYCGDLILRALALPYSDHPDFNEAWRA